MKNLEDRKKVNSIQINENSEQTNLLQQNGMNRKTETGIQISEETIIKDVVNVDSIANPDNKKRPSEADKMPKASFVDLFHFVEKDEKIILWIAIIISVAQGAALPVMTLILGDLTNSFTPDKTATQTEDLIKTQFLNMIYIGLGVLFAAFVASILWNILSARQTKKIKLIYFKKLLDQNIAWYDKTKIDQLSSNFIDQVSSFTAVFSTKMHLIFMNYSTAISGIVIGFVKGWLLTIFVLLLTPIMFFGMFFFIKAIQKSEEIQRSSYANAGSTSDECFTYIKTVKSLNGEEHEIKRYAGHCDQSKKTSIRFGYKAGLLWGIFFFSVLFMYGMAYLIGSRLISDDWFNDNYSRVYNIGDVLTIFFAVITGIFSLGNIGPLQKAMEAAKVAIALILKIVKEDQKEKYGTYKPEQIYGNFVFENVTFAYPSNPSVAVLKNINFTIKAGQKVAFVGPSGSGKSTIVQLIERFYDPTEGRILLDGVNIREYDIDYLRHKIGLVSQQPILFAESIKYNILLGIPDHEKVTDDQIWKSLDEAVASEFVRKFNHKLDEFVGSQGGQLSGGQKQRIAIARALIRKPTFFLFDEATSALDRKNEMEIQKTLDKIAENTTSLTIAHRLSTIINSDKIFVLRNGVLEQEGKHDDLMKNSQGLYFKLIEHQITGEVAEDEEENESDEAEEKLAQAFANNNQNSGLLDKSQSFELNNKFAKGSSQKIELKNSKQISFGQKQSSLNDSQSQTDIQVEAPSKKQLQLSNFLGPEKRLIGVGVIFAMCQGAIMPIFGFLLGSIIELLGKLEIFKYADKSNQVTYTKTDVLHDIDLIIVAFVIVAIGSFFFSFLQYAVFNQIGEMFTFTLRVKYFRRLMYKDLEYFDKEDNQPGAISSRLALDCKTINILIGTYVGSIFQSLSSLFVGLIISLIFSWRIGLVMLAMTPMLFVSGIVDTQMMNAEKKAQKVEGSDLLPETLNNIKVVRSLTAQSQIFRRFERFAEQHRVHSIKSSWISGFLFGFSQFSQFLIYAVIFRVGAKFQTEYGLNMKEFFVALFAIIFGGYGAGMANQFLGGLGEAKGAATKILAEINSNSKIEVDPENPASNPFPRKNLKPLITGKIEFQNVDFTYVGRKNKVLNHLNFLIPPNQSSAFVGGSGSGKSTIMQLLLRFYDPQKGQILIDGVNIKDMDIAYLRTIFGIVRQEPTLFNGTIEYNVKYNSNVISQEDVRRACEAANAMEFIEGTPDGFNRDVGNRGEKMSGGQKQRIAIARVLVRNPKILLFDEATSALDSNSEVIVQNALEEISKGRASISIAHRISTIKNSDIIFVLETGKMIEQGNYAYLMNNKGRFAELAQN